MITKSRNKREGWYAGKTQGKHVRQKYQRLVHRGHPTSNLADLVLHGYIPLRGTPGLPEGEESYENSAECKWNDAKLKEENEREEEIPYQR